MRWGEEATNKSIKKIDNPLPLKVKKKQKWFPFHGRFEKLLLSVDYIKMVDCSTIQKVWRPMWGDLYIIRTGKERIPNFKLVNLWTVRISKKTWRENREHYLNNYCWVPTPDDLVSILLQKGLFVSIEGPTENCPECVVRIESNKREYEGTGSTVFEALASTVPMFLDRVGNNRIVVEGLPFKRKRKR